MIEREKGVGVVTIFDRFNITVVASAGLFGVAMALSPGAAAVPVKTGGACIYGQAGEVAPFAGGPVGAAGAPVVAGACGAPLTDMSGIPLAAPGAVPVPLGPPLIALGPPLPPVVPLGAPVGAPLPIGAPLVALGGAPLDVVPAAPIIDMSGVKDQPTGPAPTGGPTSGQPITPGPSSPFAH
jgi:hypothetical protein